MTAFERAIRGLKYERDMRLQFKDAEVAALYSRCIEFLLEEKKNVDKETV